MMINWRIYYGDGATYSDNDGLPEDAPKRNVQVVIHSCELTGFNIEREESYYIWLSDRGGWQAVDQFGLYDYLIEPGYKIVLFGRTLSNEEYRKILEIATEDKEVPRKSAWFRGERRV